MARKTDSKGIVKTLIFCAIVLVLLFGLRSLFPAFNKKETATVKTSEQVLPTAKLATKTEKSETGTYSVEITNPVVTGLGDVVNKKINTTILAKTAEMKQSFLDDISGLAMVDGPGEKSTLSIDFDPEQKHEAYDILSLPLQVETYANGAAHPNNYKNVLHFNIKTGDVVMLPDIFKDKNTAYHTVSKVATKKLDELFAKEGNPDWFQGGAGPEADNYENFILDMDTLTIIFNPYQVAAYARGEVPIELSLSMFPDMLSLR